MTPHTDKDTDLRKEYTEEQGRKMGKAMSSSDMNQKEALREQIYIICRKSKEYEASEQIMELVTAHIAKAVADAYMQGKIDEAKICENAKRHALKRKERS